MAATLVVAARVTLAAGALLLAARPWSVGAAQAGGGIGCASNHDCSFNGVCQIAGGTGTCRCGPGWNGAACSTLDLLPLDRAGQHVLGYHAPSNHTSWGGGGWWDEHDQTWYLWASEIAGGCGMAAWYTNSMTIRASSPDPLKQPFLKEGAAFPVWTHESIVTRTPAGEYVAFMSYQVPPPVQCTGCVAGCSSANCTKKLEPHAPTHGAAGGGGGGGAGFGEAWGGVGARHGTGTGTVSGAGANDASSAHGGVATMISSRAPTYMSWAPAGGARGPWSTPVLVLDAAPQMDTNMAAAIRADGTLVGLWRDHHLNSTGAKGHSTIHLVTATNWKDNTTYTWTPYSDLLFADQGRPNPGGVEDPFLYVDGNGTFHALFHMLYPQHPYSAGGHAYSVDGREWHWTGQAYDGNLTYTDGGHGNVTNGDRPHLLFAKDGVTPIALTTAAGGTGWAAPGKLADQAYTLLRPLRH